MHHIELQRHTMRIKPAQHLLQAGVTHSRQIGHNMRAFDRAITSRLPRAYETAIAMGLAVDQQYKSFDMTKYPQAHTQIIISTHTLPI